jgi:hypothetical protein
MNEAQFQRYLQENEKTIISALRVDLPHPDKAQVKMEELLSNKWAWLVVFHNCETLVEEIVMAGGGPRLHHGLLSLPSKSMNQCSDWQ